jgi:hypothetical protein
MDKRLQGTPERTLGRATLVTSMPAAEMRRQGPMAQKRAMIKERLNHRLLSDPRLQLPTFTDKGLRRYRRLALVVHDGCIVKVFCPMSSAARSAAQAIAWMTIQGIS